MVDFDGNRFHVSRGGSLSYSYLREIKYVLGQGGVLIIPSDTCYSLASLPFIAGSISRIANIEPDLMKKEIPLSFSSLSMLERFCILTSRDYRIIDDFCPGPITLVCEMKKKMIDRNFDEMINTNKTIGIRIPDSPIERQICDYINSPITTCAVRDDKKNVVQNYDDVVSIVQSRIENVIDDYHIMAIEIPEFEYKEASTVISVQPNIIGSDQIKVFREGSIDSVKITRKSGGVTWYDFEDWT